MIRFFPVWRRNLLVWRKLALPSILGNLADPMIYMLGLGYGLGAMLPEVDGVQYVVFLSQAGVRFHHEQRHVRSDVLAFSRMQVQKMWKRHECLSMSRISSSPRRSLGGDQACSRARHTARHMGAGPVAVWLSLWVLA